MTHTAYGLLHRPYSYGPLEQPARQILARLEIVGAGTTAAWNPAGGTDAERPILPSGERNPPHHQVRATFDRHAERRDWAKLEAAIAEAQELLEQLTRRTHSLAPAGETLQQRNQRMIHEGSGWTVQDVARAFRCLEREVIRVRLEAGVDPDTGRHHPETHGARDRVLELHSRGFSMRQIEQATGVSRSTAHRIIKSSHA
jgi:uncharacterized protein YerC